MKNLAEAQDSLSAVESKNFQRLALKMLHHGVDDPTIQFEMAMVMSGMCKPTVGAMARLMRVIRYCIDKPTLSWRFKLDRQQQCLWMQTTHLMRRRARACRAVTRTWSIASSRLSQLAKQRSHCHRISQNYTR